jgi:glycosyltransferase involved in cell wall biosynthesis
VSGRRLLVVTYYYPPQPGSGSNRWAAMVKYLRRLGHQVSVVTAAPPGHAPGEDGGVLRTANLNSSPLLRRLLLRSGRTPAMSSTDAGGEQAGGTLPPLLWKGIVPDPWLVTWNPAAWRAIRRLHREQRFDCLITSSPAASTHLLGLALGARRPAWIADFRDGWLFEPLLPPFPTPPQRALDRWLERRTARGADAVVAVTAPIAEDFKQRLNVAAEHVPNGWDPESGSGPATASPLDDGRLTLVHVGAMSGAWGRDPRPLLQALRRLIGEHPQAAERIQLVLAGRLEEQERTLLEAHADLGDVIRHLGYIPREEALALQRSAGALVLITSRNRGEATGKLYEYMAAGRPVIALAEGNEAARIVAETNIGVTVPPDDVEAITGALRAALGGELQRAYAPRGIEAYAYPALAERMSSLIETAIERRACAG